MDRRNYIIGLIYGGSAFVLWGLLPIYWKMLGAINPYQIFAQRVVWSFLFVAVILVFKGQWTEFISVVKDRTRWLSILGLAVSISINWIVFIWAVNSGYVLEASLGYYINPLVLTAFGAIFFKERLPGMQKIGLAIAGTGVLIKSVVYGQIPWIALILAFAFGTYGLLKKKSALTSLVGLAFETLVIGFPSMIYLIFVETTGAGITGNLPLSFWLIVSTSGAITAIPLLLYAEGTRRLPLSIIGFLQFIGPSLMLVLGVFAFGEVFDQSEIIAFSFIWVGLMFFSYSQYKVLSK